MKRPRSLRKVRGFGILLGVAAALSMLTVSLVGGTPQSASGATAPGQAKAKRYKATRPFVVDKQTGEVRLPTQAEVDEVVATLTALGQRQAETLPQSAHAGGAVTVDLDGGFNGVLLSRPDDDGTWETKCVFSLEEGADFLGFVEDESAR